MHSHAYILGPKAKPWPKVDGPAAARLAGRPLWRMETVGGVWGAEPPRECASGHCNVGYMANYGNLLSVI